MDKDFEKIAQEQSLIIESLSTLCTEVIANLSQYRDVDYEENMLNNISDNPFV